MKNKKILVMIVMICMFLGISSTCVFAELLTLEDYDRLDFNNDGYLNEEDVTLLVKSFFDEIYFEEGDLNSSGRLDLTDITLYVRLLFDETNFPKGDLNRDGAIMQDDYEYALELLNGQSDSQLFVLELSDLNGDGEFTEDDANEILKIAVKQGDIDKNGVINSDDAAIALDIYRYGNETVEQRRVGDMDKNNIINSDDAALILDVYRYGE